MNGFKHNGRTAAALFAVLCMVASIAAVPLRAAPNPDNEVDSVIVKKNLFRTDRRPPPPPEFKLVIKRPVRGLKYVKFEGVVSLGGVMKALVKAPFMFLDDKSKTKGLDYVWVKAGDKLGQYTVVSIDNGKLVMKNGDKVHTLKLGEDGKKKKKMDKKPLFSKRSHRFRKPGSLFMVYGSNGLLTTEGDIAELGAPDLVPDSASLPGGRLDILSDKTLAENEEDEDAETQKSDTKRSSSTPSWAHSGWSQVASLDPSPVFSPSSSSPTIDAGEPAPVAEPTPTTVTKTVNIVVNNDPVVQEKPDIPNDDDDDDDDDVDVCDTCTCTLPNDWIEACCGERPSSDESCKGVTCDSNDPDNWDVACCGPLPESDPEKEEECTCWPLDDPPACCQISAPPCCSDPVERPGFIGG